MMLRQFVKALGSLEWPANDKAIFQDLMPSTADEIVSWSSSKWLRAVYKGHGLLSLSKRYHPE